MEPIRLTVRYDRIGPIVGHHPWVFSGALKNIPDKIESGTPVHLISDKGQFLAHGYFNSYSQIAVRIWSYDENEEVDYDFFEKRIRGAYEIRKNWVESKKTDSYRLVNSENDLLPGLIVDKYGDYFSVQFHTRGIEKWKKEIVDSLVAVFDPKGIYERSDIAVRKIEELEEKSGLLYGTSFANDVPDKVKILENGYKFYVDIKTGQKTGFFLDQRDKRAAIQKYCEGKNVLNCFSYTGGFSVYALSAAASKVVSVDTSQSALDLANENIGLNKLDKKSCEFVCEDVKLYLQNIKPGDFDLIILDPPAFIKDRRKKEEGIVGYKKINEAALRALSSGSILVTCSCSAHLSLSDFRYILSESAGRAGKTVQILETLIHGIDHPQLVAYTEGEYLKCFIVRIV